MARRAIQQLGWKIDDANGNLGLVTFQTGISWVHGVEFLVHSILKSLRLVVLRSPDLANKTSGAASLLRLTLAVKRKVKRARL